MSRIHTPGPWRLSPGSGGQYGSVVADVPAHPRRTAEELQEEVGYYGGYVIGESIAPQNRPLIAFAPQLLAACEDAHKVLSLCLDVKDQRLVEHLLFQAMNRLGYAIEKLDELERGVA